MPHTSSSSILLKVKCEENFLKVGQAIKSNLKDIQSFSKQGMDINDLVEVVIIKSNHWSQFSSKILVHLLSRMKPCSQGSKD